MLVILNFIFLAYNFEVYLHQKVFYMHKVYTLLCFDPPTSQWEATMVRGLFFSSHFWLNERKLCEYEVN